MGLPRHIAIIMDGNGRWAQLHGNPRTDGHRVGVDVAEVIVTHCRELGIKYLTLYTFSVENWSRPKIEVGFLFDLLVKFLTEKTKKLIKNGIRLNLYGNFEGLPAPTRFALSEAIEKTSECSAMTLNLALNYSGRMEIAKSVQKLIRDGINPENITEADIASHLYSAGQPDPDLLIRTGGEFRLSNFLPFQMVYTELYFTDILWPVFTPSDLDDAISWYQTRERRFGLTSQQIKEME